MGRILSIVLAVFWTALFASAAISAVSGIVDASAAGMDGVVRLFAATGSALVATTFLWMAVAACSTDDPSDLREVAALAVACACGLVTVRAAWLGAFDVSAVTHVCALLLTYMTTSLPVEARKRPEPEKTMARAMAGDAASLAVWSPGREPAGEPV
jgi:hypothetical protein